MPIAWTTDRDRRLLLALYAANLDKIKVDNKLLAEICGGTTKDGVDHRFRVLKKEARELLDSYNEGEAPPQVVTRQRSAPNTPKKPRGVFKTEASPKKRKRTVAVKPEYQNDDSYEDNCLYV